MGYGLIPMRERGDKTLGRMMRIGEMVVVGKEDAGKSRDQSLP